MTKIGYKQPKEVIENRRKKIIKEKIPVVCQECGITIYLKPNKAKGRKYCSSKCFYQNIPSGKNNPLYGRPSPNRVDSILIICEYCGKEFYVKPCKKNAKYCSNKCRHSSGHSEETKEKLRQKALEQFKDGVPQETKDKIGKAQIGQRLGSKNPAWLGGKSFEKYGMEFNNKLREKIRQRDNYKCQMCWTTENDVDHKLSVHHIDYDKKNNSENNLILLCRKCHSKTNFTREDWQIHFQELFKKPKIFVSILNEGWIRTELTFALTKWFKESDYRVYLEAPSDRPIENNRNKITKRFLNTGYDYLLQIDADNIPARNPLELVEYKKDIISCPVPVRSHSTTFLNVFKLDDDGSLVPLKQEENKGLTKISATGTGCIMCSRKVFEKIQAPFERQYNAEGIETLGLDLFFSQKAIEAGFEIYTHFCYKAKHFKEIDLSSL